MKLGKFWNFLICVGFILLLVGFSILMLVTMDKFDFGRMNANHIAFIGAFLFIGIELIFIYRANVTEMHPLMILIPAALAIGDAAFILTGGMKFSMAEPFQYHIRFAIAPTAGILGAYQILCSLGFIEKYREKYDWLLNLAIPCGITVLSLGLFTLLAKYDYKDPNWLMNVANLISLTVGGGIVLLPAAGVGLVSLLGGGGSSSSHSSRGSSGGSSSGSGKKLSEKDVWYLVYGKEGWAGSCKAKIEDVNISGRSGSGQMYHSSFSITATIEVKVRMSSYQSQQRMEDDVNRAAQAALNSAESALQRAGVGYEISCRVKPVSD